MSLQDHAQKFDELKKANSPWLTIADGETVNIIQLRSFRAGTEEDDKGITSAKMYFDFDVETSEGIKVKKLTTSSQKLIDLFIEQGIDIGSSFKLKRMGEKFDTRYEVTDVVNKPKAPKQGELGGADAAVKPATPPAGEVKA